MAKVEYPQDPIVEKVLQRIAKRADQGLVKFGCPISEARKTHVQWLRDIQEEMMDACVYIERLIVQVQQTIVDAEAMVSRARTNGDFPG